MVGGELETTVESFEVTGSLEVPDAGCVSSDVEKNVYVTLPEAGGVDDGAGVADGGAGVAGADAGADAGVGVAPAASVGTAPTLSTTIGALANGSGLLVLDVRGVAMFVCTSATMGTCLTAGFTAVFRSASRGPGAAVGGVTAAFGAACSFGDREAREAQRRELQRDRGATRARHPQRLDRRRGIEERDEREHREREPIPKGIAAGSTPAVAEWRIDRCCVHRTLQPPQSPDPSTAPSVLHAPKRTPMRNSRGDRVVCIPETRDSPAVHRWRCTSSSWARFSRFAARATSAS